MNKVDCCYNCKHCMQGWVIVKDSSQQTMMCDVLKEFVKPNNKCEKWGGESRMRTYISEEKREYEKMYEATTGKVSHKILIELDQEQEMFVRKLAEKNHTSISKIAESMISHSIWRMTGWEKAIQTPVEYTTSEQK